MEESWNLIKCSCGHHFGVKKNNKMVCWRCSNSTNFTIKNTYSSASELRENVASSNAPKDILKVIISKSKHKNKNIDNIENLDNINKLQIIMNNIVPISGVLTLDILANELIKKSISNISAEELVETMEYEGLIIRSGHKEWKLL